MNTVTIFVHGFNVWDGGRQSVGKLRSFFAPTGPYVMLNYGHYGLLKTRFRNDKVALRLHNAVINAKSNYSRVIVVGHSNGCAIIHRAAEKWNTPIDKAVYINPALKKHYAPEPSVLAVDVWHSPSDKPVRWARWLPAANARPWGEMGAVGYQGSDERIRNFNKEYDFDVSSDGHSDVFLAEKITFFGSRIYRESMACQV